MKPEKALLYAAFWADFCYSLAALTIPLVLVKELGYGTLECGWMAAAASCTYTISCFLFGKLSQREDQRKFWSLLGIAWFTAGVVGLSFMGSLAGFFLWAATAPALGLFWPVVQAWMGGRCPPVETSRRLRHFNLAWTLGMMVGYLAAGGLYSLGARFSFLLAAAIMVGLGFVIAAVRTPPAAPLPAVDFSPIPFRGADLLLLSYLCNFTAYFSLGIVRGLYPDLGHSISFSAELIGGLAAALMGMQAVAFYLLTDPNLMYSRKLLFSSLVLGMAGLACLFLFVSPWAHLLGMLLLGVMAAVAYKFSLYHSIVRPPGRRTLTGNHEGILSAGMLVGPLVGSYAGHLLSSHVAPYQLAAWVTLAALALFAWEWWTAARRAGRRIP